jgi:hypothetical protein
MIWVRRREYEVIQFKSRGGSVEHFYHFFFGALVPLANYLSTDDRKDLCFVRSCGPMNRHLLNLNLDSLVIVDKASIARLAKVFKRTLLHGFDEPQYYDRGIFLRSRDFIMKHFNKAPIGGRDKTLEPASIVLVERGVGDPYYSSSLSEAKSSGKSRRSVPNIEEIALALRKHGKNGNVFQLESMSLEEQSRIFGSAQIVVAQHGAALANIMWMKTGAKVVEITSLPTNTCFSELSKTCGVRHELVLQKSNHAPVDVDAIVAAVMR